MNISKAETLVRPVLDNFSDFIGQSFECRVYLIGKDETDEPRKDIYEQLNARFERYTEGCVSETVVGKAGYAILLYPFAIFSARDFTHNLLHECGHVYFRLMNQEICEAHINGRLTDEAHMGYTLFDEFIAEAIANMADPETAYFDEETRRAALVHTLYSAIPGINREPTRQAMEESTMFARTCVYVLPARLGQYAAMLLTDPTIVMMLSHDRTCETGLSACGEAVAAEVRAIIKGLTDYLDSYIGEAPVDNSLLCDIGKRLINIWKLRSGIKK